VGLAALGIGPGDEVIVPTYTWVATINAIVTLGAVPVFVDIDPSLTMDPGAIEAAITPSTVAVVPVHTRGAGADMQGAWPRTPDGLPGRALPAASTVGLSAAPAAGAGQLETRDHSPFRVD
jgi:DegT/DnrJ/EryC1/StrS aminotransferase family protein